MDKWIIILTTDLPQEAHLAKTMLESEGINVWIKDELTAQVNNFYSNAIGGVKLQVSESDSKRAVDILKASGYIKEPVKKENKLLERFDGLTSKLPFIGKTILEFRLIGFIALIIFLIIALILIYSQPNLIL